MLSRHAEVLFWVGRYLQRAAQTGQLVSITAVDVSKDMKHAKVFITQMGKDCEALEALTHAAGYLRRELGSRLTMKITPELRFEYDHSVERGMELSNLIDELNKGQT